MRRRLLEVLANGDWSRRGRFELWIVPGLQVDEARLKDIIVKGVLIALTGRVYRAYPRHRWLGSDEAVDEIALAESCHGLASQAFSHMCGQARADAAACPSAEEEGIQARETRRAPEDRPGAGGSNAPDPFIVHASVQHTSQAAPQPQEFVEGEEQGTAAAGEEGPSDFAALNNRRKRIALAWLAAEPLHRLQMLRKYLQPLCGLMSGYITTAGADWELRQRGTEALALDKDQQSPTRAHCLLRYIHLVAETEFYQHLKQLTEPRLEGHTPQAPQCGLPASGLSDIEQNGLSL